MNNAGEHVSAVEFALPCEVFAALQRDTGSVKAQ